MPKVCFALVWTLFCGACLAQANVDTHHVQATPTVAPEVAAVVQQMASQASVIFIGRVAAVVRDDARGIVEVEFQVDQPVRGLTGKSYTLREWAGRWVGLPDRYRVGQTFLMLLAAPGAQGISAPVCGEDGAIPLTGSAAGPVLTADGSVSPDLGMAEQSADLRRLSTRALRAAAAPYRADSVGTDDAWTGPVPPLRAGGDQGTTLFPPTSVVLGLFGAAYAAR